MMTRKKLDVIMTKILNLYFSIAPIPYFLVSMVYFLKDTPLLMAILLSIITTLGCILASIIAFVFIYATINSFVDKFFIAKESS